MISHVVGRVVEVGPQSVVVELGGVGLLVMCSPATLAGLAAEEDVRLATSLVVREDSLTLYGFSSDEERSIFELLQTASGVGPKLAQAICAVHPPGQLRRVIAQGDVAALTSVPGVGKKGAQRLILELKDRLGPLKVEDRESQGQRSRASKQVSEGLIALGWSPAQAEKVAADTVAAFAEEENVSVLLKYALGMMGRVR